MFGVVVKASGLGWEQANILLSGSRTDQSINLLRKLFDAQDDLRAFPGVGAREDFAACFIQMKAISLVRNSLVHYGISADDQKFTTSNAMRSLRDRKVMYDVPPDCLHGMIVDLRKIVGLITFHSWLHDNPELRSASDEQYQALKRPWRYIHQPQESSDPPRRGTRPKPPNQPRPSLK